MNQNYDPQSITPAHLAKAGIAFLRQQNSEAHVDADARFTRDMKTLELARAGKLDQEQQAKLDLVMRGDGEKKDGTAR